MHLIRRAIRKHPYSTYLDVKELRLILQYITPDDVEDILSMQKANFRWSTIITRMTERIARKISRPVRNSTIKWMVKQISLDLIYLRRWGPLPRLVRRRG